MAMNKKEIAEHAAEVAEHAAYAAHWKLRAALTWTNEVEPDLLPPTGFRELTKGFLFNTHDPRVIPACSSSIHHGFGQDDKTTSQGTRSLYSTKLLALKGLRHAVEMQSAERLIRIDALIEAEKQAERLRNIDALASASTGPQE